MARPRFYWLLAASFFLPASAHGGTTSNPHIWFVDSLIKIFPTDSAVGTTFRTPELWAARGQHVSVQLAIRSVERLEAVTAQVGPFKDAMGATLADATVQPEGFVVVGSHSRHTPEDEWVGEAPGWFPDPLLDFPIDIPPQHTQPLWISVKVPEDTRPGDYRAAVVVRASNRQVARQDILVKVFSATVPGRRTLKATNWFGFDNATSRQFYGVAQFSPGWWQLVANVGAVMAEHRQNVILTPLMDLIDPKLKEGKLVYDFAKFDRWVETFQRAGAIGYIEGTHLLDRGGSYNGSVTVRTFQVENDHWVAQALSP